MKVKQKQKNNTSYIVKQSKINIYININKSKQENLKYLNSLKKNYKKKKKINKSMKKKIKKKGNSHYR